MALAKLRIGVYGLKKDDVLEFKYALEVLFNPNQITIQKTVNWSDAPTAQRDVVASQSTHADPATLTMDLFFDTYEGGTDVRKHTDQIAYLARIETHGELHHPPICQLSWGSSRMFFQGVLQGLNQRFTLFLADGTPVRATLGCTFKEWRTNKEEVRLLNKKSSDVAKRRILQRGDTLSNIAAEEYHDPKLWRPIAETNRIDDPRKLTPGSLLLIPSLSDERGAQR